MKKIVSLIVILCMLCTSVYASPLSLSKQGDIHIAYINNVGSDSNRLNNNIIDKGSNEITSKDANITINKDNSFTVQGSINGKDFQVMASPKGSVNSNVYILNGEDIKGNNDILYVSYERNIQDSLMYFRDIYEKMSYNNMVKLYMQPKGSDDIVIIEIFDPNLSLFNMRSLNKSSEDLSLDQFWYGKVFEPVEKEEMYTLRNSTDYNYGSYIYEYNHLGADIKQVFKIMRYVESPSQVTANSAFTTILEVVDEYTECLWFPNENSNNTHMMINEAGIDIAVDDGDACSEYYIDGLVKSGGSFDVDFQWNTGVSLGSVASINLNYNRVIHNLDLNSTHEILANGSDGYYRELGTKLEDGNKLDSEGHSFKTKWLLTNYDHQTKYGQQFKVKFRYHMVNLLDYTHWINGDKTYTETKTYTSRP